MVTQEQIDRAKAAAVTTGYWLAAEAAFDAADATAEDAFDKYWEMKQEFDNESN